MPLLSTPLSVHDLQQLTHSHSHQDHDDDDTEDVADLLLKRDLTTAHLRRRYTLEDKYDVVTKVQDDGTNKKEVAEQFGINKATLNAWLRQKKSIIKQCKGVQERQRFSYQQKHEILSKIKADKSNKKEIIDAFGVKKHTLNTWLRHRVDIARTSEDLPARKANYHSAIWRIYQGVDAFFAENQMREGKDRINITGCVLGIHANKIKEELLERHAKQEIVLDDQELKHLTKFKGSDSWGRKYAQAKGWRGPEYQNTGNHASTSMMIHHQHDDDDDDEDEVGDASDALEQHAAHHQHHQEQLGGLSVNHDNNSDNNMNNNSGIVMNSMDNGIKPDESYGYHMYAHNIQQMAPNHLTVPQPNSIDPLSNLQHSHMHHPQQPLLAVNDNSMPPPTMLSQHQQVMQQQMQHHHHQSMHQQQAMQHHIQHMGAQHTLDNSLVGHDPNHTMGMPQPQPLQQPPNVADPRSYNTFV